MSYLDNRDRLHREDGPAFLFYTKSGALTRETYYVDGHYHRIGGPSVLWYYENGSIRYESYHKKGVAHREDGPACIEYCKYGGVISAGYWLEGDPYKFWEYYDISSSETQKALLKNWLPCL